VALANSWIIINVGGGPTDDKPAVTLETPRDPDLASSFLNIRVSDIQAVYAEWSARGAELEGVTQIWPCCAAAIAGGANLKRSREDHPARAARVSSWRRRQERRLDGAAGCAAGWRVSGRRPGPDRLADLPLVPERIDDPAQPPAVLIANGGLLRGTGPDRLPHHGVGVIALPGLVQDACPERGRVASDGLASSLPSPDWALPSRARGVICRYRNRAGPCGRATRRL
jgi:hypothetical protein